MKKVLNNYYLLAGLFLTISTISCFSQILGCPGVIVSDSVTINCASSGITELSANYLEIGETTSYSVSPISYEPPYSFTGLENPISVGTDDIWSPIVNLPFNFCFYGNMYTECIISSNGAISFDTSSNLASGYSSWSFSESLPDPNLFLNTIFGVYHDMDPSMGGEIAWELLGTAPCRKLVVSYHDVPLYWCASITSTFQLVLYEGTNIIELYVEEKPACSSWNSGNSLIGVQNLSGNLGLAPPGRNTTDWSVSSSAPEAWRFTPSGTDMTSIRWYDEATGGSVVGSTNTISVSPISTTTYRAEVEYLMCDGSLIVESDTVTVNIDFCPSSIDFDGIDDYVIVDSVIDPVGTLSCMAWVKLDTSFSGDSWIIGESNSSLFLDQDATVRAKITTDSGTYITATTEAVNSGEWVHLAYVYNGTSLNIYINGEESASTSVSGSALIPSTSSFFIGRHPISSSDYIKADIQEVKVYDVALTQNQLQEQIYQPIINNGGNASGFVTGKDISGLSWGNLKLYLKLTSAVTGTTSDDSSIANTALLHNMTTTQETTAPIPYVANASGQWTTTGTWEYGNVWDIENLPNKDWAIVQISNSAKVTTTSSHTHLGLLLDPGTELEIQNDQLLQNTKYLKLDGVIDLVGESQLIQTSMSELEVSSGGSLERDQDGKSNLFQYNYWSSPVNPINGISNNTNYSVAEVLKDGTIPAAPQNINWVEGYDGSPGSPISIADFWIFKFIDSPDTYTNWIQSFSSGSIKVGEGYTLKGSGASSSTQNYTFLGKPNNGLIGHSIGGDHMSLLGNPYPSALDAYAFINDNIESNPSTTGALYFWEHWGGNSHNLAAYEGGYSTLNLTGHVMAVSDPMVSSNGTGVIVPKRYVPVAQGFMVYGDTDGGTIEFNNSQRVFEKESGGNSTFVRASGNATLEENLDDNLDRVYFNFISPEGATRQLLLGVKYGLTEAIDYGYDAKRFNEQYTDCGWKIAEEAYVIQGIGEIYEDLELPLIIKVGAAGQCKFNVSSLADLNENIEVYFKDAELQTETVLDHNLEASLYLESGNYTNRFSLVFKASEILDIEETLINELMVFYNSSKEEVNIINPSSFLISKIRLIDILGKEIMTYGHKYIGVTEILLPVKLADGIYLVEFMIENNRVVKKIIIN